MFTKVIKIDVLVRSGIRPRGYLAEKELVYSQRSDKAYSVVRKHAQRESKIIHDYHQLLNILGETEDKRDNIQLIVDDFQKGYLVMPEDDHVDDYGGYDAELEAYNDKIDEIELMISEEWNRINPELDKIRTQKDKKLSEARKFENKIKLLHKTPAILDKELNRIDSLIDVYSNIYRRTRASFDDYKNEHFLRTEVSEIREKGGPVTDDDFQILYTLKVASTLRDLENLKNSMIAFRLNQTRATFDQFKTDFNKLKKLSHWRTELMRGKDIIRPRLKDSFENLVLLVKNLS